MPVCWSRPLAVALLLGLALAARPAAAQTPAADEARKADGRSHFQRGLELSDDQAWDAAYAEYVTSIAIYPTKAATISFGASAKVSLSAKGAARAVNIATATG